MCQLLNERNIQSLSRSLSNTAGQVMETDVYFGLGAVNYSPTTLRLGTASNDSSTGNYHATTYSYDQRGRQNKVVDPSGTITRTVYDGQARVLSVWIGTSDSGWSNSSGGGNMTRLASNIYDNGGVGDGNLTESVAYPGGSQAPRATLGFFDWQDRQVASKQGALVDGSGTPTPSVETDSAHRPILFSTYDNLGEVLQQDLYDGDGVSVASSAGVVSAPASSLLRARSTSSYDPQSRVYRSQVFSVDPISGAVSSDSLTSNQYYDHRGNQIASVGPTGLWSKSVIDGAGRTTASYSSDGGMLALGSAAFNWTNAITISHDVVLSETDITYDADSNAILTVSKQRFHDDPQTGSGATGPLGSPSAAPFARDSYMASYFDAGDRPTDSVNVGTNGGSAYSRPSSFPASSDTVLVNHTDYAASGGVLDTIDPRGIVTRQSHDLLGRTISTIAAFSDGTPTDATNQSTYYTYNGNGAVLTMMAVMPSGTPTQITAYTYGVSPADGSTVSSNDLLRQVSYPDKSSGLPGTAATDQEIYSYDAAGEVISKGDQNGTLHAYVYDSLGRQTSDSVPVLGSGVDGAVRRHGFSFDARGNLVNATSYSDTAGTTVYNQVRRLYNGLGQLTTEYQEYLGAVNLSTSAKVQYGYGPLTSGSQRTSIIYPGGTAGALLVPRILHYGYDGSALDAAIGRIDYLADDNGSGGIGSHIADYSYLGLDTIVQQLDGNGVALTYVHQTGDAQAITDAGDQYTGRDRFGRILDQNWVNLATGVSTDRFQYGYDRDSNVLYKNNLVNSTFSELYHANSSAAGDNASGYDPLSRLTGFSRGTLTASGNNGSGLDTITTANLNALAGHTATWSLDAVGNWNSSSTDGVSTSRTSNAVNQYVTVGAASVHYDANGDFIVIQPGQITQFVYDAWGHWTRGATGYIIGEAASYDAYGRQISTGTAALKTSLFYSDSWQLLEERQTVRITFGAGTMFTDQYVWGLGYVDDLVLRDYRQTSKNGLTLYSSNRLYSQHDANWNIIAIVDSSGSVAERFVYDPYGSQTVLSAAWASGTDAFSWLHGFQGGRLDLNVGLYSFRHRDYSPTLGRWIEPDPAGYVDGMNRYQMERSSPVGFGDAMGLASDGERGILKGWGPYPGAGLGFDEPPPPPQPNPTISSDGSDGSSISSAPWQPPPSSSTSNSLGYKLAENYAWYHGQDFRYQTQIVYDELNEMRSLTKSDRDSFFWHFTKGLATSTWRRSNVRYMNAAPYGFKKDGTFYAAPSRMFDAGWWLGHSSEVDVEGDFEARLCNGFLWVRKVNLNWWWHDAIVANGPIKLWSKTDSSIAWFLEGVAGKAAETVTFSGYKVVIPWEDYEEKERIVWYRESPAPRKTPLPSSSGIIQIRHPPYILHRCY